MNKPFLLSIAIVFASIAAIAQPMTDHRPETRYIEVSGSAEEEVTPDEIYFSITLREYFDGKNRVDIDQLDKRFLKALADQGIDRKNLEVQSIYGCQYKEKKKDDPNFFASKTYRLKVTNLAQTDPLLASLAEMKASNFYIERTDYSKKEELQKQLKIKAVKNAKAKADYLAEALGATVGEALYLREAETPIYNPYRANTYMMAKDAGGMESNPDDDIQHQKIKFRGEVAVHFRLK